MYTVVLYVSRPGSGKMFHTIQLPFPPMKDMALILGEGQGAYSVTLKGVGWMMESESFICPCEPEPEWDALPGLGWSANI